MSVTYSVSIEPYHAYQNRVTITREITDSSKEGSRFQILDQAGEWRDAPRFIAGYADFDLGFQIGNHPPKRKVHFATNGDWMLPTNCGYPEEFQRVEHK